jgi:hypothetical protein
VGGTCLSIENADSKIRCFKGFGKMRAEPVPMVPTLGFWLLPLKFHKKSLMKHWFGKVHRWLGLPLGGLFLIISLSGAIYCWEPEFAAILYKGKIEPLEKPFVPIASLRESVLQVLPEADFRTVFYRGPSRAVQLLLYVPGTYYHANLNPYTGELIHLQDIKKAGSTI